MDIIQRVFKTFNFSDENVEVQISLRDPMNYEVVASQRRERSGNTEKYIGSDEDWASAEQAIIDACEEKGMKARKEVGEAAFYGPKLDFMVKDAIGRRWQLGTIQVDYQLPQRFQLEYIGEDNVRRRSRADRRE